MSFLKKLFGTTKYNSEYQPAIILRMTEILLDGLKENLQKEEEVIHAVVLNLIKGRSLPEIENNLVDMRLIREDIRELMLRAKVAKTYGDETSKKMCEEIYELWQNFKNKGQNNEHLQ